MKLILGLVLVLEAALAQEHPDLASGQKNSSVNHASQVARDLNPDPGVWLPKLIDADFFRKSEICESARAQQPPKKAALILLSTHECDSGGNVCISSLTTLSDPANAFVHENFATFHTQFTRWEMQPEGMKQVHFAKEQEIRKEWQKPDTMPEIAIMDLKTCRVIGRKHMHDNPNAFKTDFMKRYAAVRENVLSIPGAQALLKVSPSIQPEERAQVKALRAKYPQLNTMRVYRAAAIVSERQQSVATRKLHRINSSRLTNINAMSILTGQKKIEAPILRTDEEAQEEARYEYSFMVESIGGLSQNQVGYFYYCPKEGCSKLPTNVKRLTDPGFILLNK